MWLPERSSPTQGWEPPANVGHLKLGDDAGVHCRLRPHPRGSVIRRHGASKASDASCTLNLIVARPASDGATDGWSTVWRPFGIETATQPYTMGPVALSIGSRLRFLGPRHQC